MPFASYLEDIAERRGGHTPRPRQRSFGSLNDLGLQFLDKAICQMADVSSKYEHDAGVAADRYVRATSTWKEALAKSERKGIGKVMRKAFDAKRDFEEKLARLVNNSFGKKKLSYQKALKALRERSF